MRKIYFPALLLVMGINLVGCNGSTPAAMVETAANPTVNLTVYFTDMPRYQVGTEPYETAVIRTVTAPPTLPERGPDPVVSRSHPG